MSSVNKSARCCAACFGSYTHNSMPTCLRRAHGGADLLSTFGDHGLMFALDQGGGTSYRGTSQACRARWWLC